jgi:hypothetical protein
MAQVGDASINAFVLSQENRLSGIVFTLANNATINFVRARLRDNATANSHQVRAAIYSGNTLVASSASRQDIGNTEATYDFTIGYAANAGTYRAVIFGDSGNTGGDIELYCDFVGGEGVTDDNVFTYPDLPNPADLQVADVRYSMLVDYTEGGGGGALKPPSDMNGGFSDLTGGMQ